MKNIMLSFIIIILASCHFDSLHNNNYINPELDSVITKYVNQYPEDDIYTLCFYQFNNNQFFNIQCSGSFYDSNFADVCFLKNNKIIVAWSMNKSLMDSLINISPLNQCYDSLKKYNDCNDTELMYYDKNHHAENYRILKLNNYRIANESDFEFTDSAHSCNIIKSQTLNSILNNYLNEFTPQITYIRFYSEKGLDYLIIGNDFVYDKNSFSGMFYRDGRIVVIYDLDKLHTQNLIDRTQLLPVNELKDYKVVRRSSAIFIEKKFKIKSNKEIVQLHSQFFSAPTIE